MSEGPEEIWAFRGGLWCENLRTGKAPRGGVRYIRADKMKAHMTEDWRAGCTCNRAGICRLCQIAEHIDSLCSHLDAKQKLIDSQVERIRGLEQERDEARKEAINWRNQWRNAFKPNLMPPVPWDVLRPEDPRG